MGAVFFRVVVGSFLGVFLGVFCWAVGWVPWVYSEKLCASFVYLEALCAF